jgi:hypothetical protein
MILMLHLKSFVLIGVTAGMMACSLNPSHIPDLQPVPLFKEKGEAQVTVSLADQKGLVVATGFAISKSIALLASGAYVQQDNCWTCSKQVNRQFELAIGTFQGSENSKIREVYVGSGLGRFETLGNSGKFDPGPEDLFISESKYQQLFVQGNIGSKGMYFDKAGSLRASVHRFYDFTLWDGNENDRLAPKTHFGVFLEPAITLGFGYKGFKLHPQMGMSLPIIQAKGLDNQLAWVSIGYSQNLSLF